MFLWYENPSYQDFNQPSALCPIAGNRVFIDLENIVTGKQLRVSALAASQGMSQQALTV